MLELLGRPSIDGLEGAPAPTPAVGAADAAHYPTDIAGSLRKLDKIAERT